MLQAILTYIGNLFLRLGNPNYEKDRDKYEAELKRIGVENEILLAQVAEGRRVRDSLLAQERQSQFEVESVRLRMHELEQERMALDTKVLEIEAEHKKIRDAIPPSDHKHVDLGDV